LASVLDLAKSALKEIGVYSAGEPLAAEDGADALAALNRLVDQMAAEGLMIYSLSRTLFTITSGLGTYTVGSGFAVNRARPMTVAAVTFIDTSTTPETEYPLSPLTDDEWINIPQRDVESTLPAAWYYDPTFPNGTLSLYPIPTNSNLQGAFYAPTAITSFASLATTVSLPPAYEEFLITNLAKNLASSYSKQPDPLLLDRARESKAIVKRSNSKPKDLYFEPVIGGGGRYDIYTDRNL
jgi:hypothetical protein